MAVQKGSDGVVSVAGSNIGELRDWSLEESAETIDSTNLSASAKTFEVGTTSWNGSANAFWVNNDTAQDALTVGAEVALIFYPEGEASGDKKATGTGIVTGISKSAGVDGLVEASFTFQGDGTLTWGAVV